VGDGKTHLVRNAGLVGLLNRWLSQRATLVQCHATRRTAVSGVEERHGPKAAHIDSVPSSWKPMPDSPPVEGAVVLGRPRLMQVDGIQCEAPLTGNSCS